MLGYKIDVWIKILRQTALTHLMPAYHNLNCGIIPITYQNE